LIVQGRGTTRLRYRFTDVKHARAHVHEAGGRALFFIPDDKLRFLPDAPVCLAFSFETGDVPRLLHGRAAGPVDGSGTWVELDDTRQLRDLAAATPRRSVRTGCDAPVEARSERRISSGHMLDLSAGGARFSGLADLVPGDRVELRLLSKTDLHSDDKWYVEAYKIYMNLVWLNGVVGSGAGDVAGGADYRPTDASLEVLEGIDRDLSAARAEFSRVMDQDLPAFNRSASAAGLAPVRPDR